MKSATRSWVLIGAVLFIAFIAGINIGMYATLHGSQLALPEAITSRINYAKPPEPFDGGNDRPSIIDGPESNGAVAIADPIVSEPPRSTPAATRRPEETSPGVSTVIKSPAVVNNKDQMKDPLVQLSSEDNASKEGVEPLRRGRVDVKGPVGAYIASGARIPILMVTCNRPDLLKTTLNSLLAARGVKASDIIVIQDGSLQSVADIVKGRDLKLIQNTDGLRLRGGAGTDGGARIAMHYKYALSRVFAEVPEAPAVIIVEDDLLFSPDFYEYFHTIGPILDVDKTVFALSAWNDNGFEGKVSDPFRLLRTNYFPGLGWMLSRDLYKSELEAHWPSSHWDHWLRSMGINKGREVVHPEVPRTYHNGVKGTFMDTDMHNRYFRSIAYNTNPSVSWVDQQATTTTPLFSSTTSDAYEENIHKTIQSCEHVSDINQFVKSKVGSTQCIWINIAHEAETSTPPFYPMSTFFGIWHEYRRGAHNGMHAFHWLGRNVLIINTMPYHHSIPTYARFMPPGARHLSPTDFRIELANEMRKAIAPSAKSITIAAKSVGINCNEVCSEQQLQCDPYGFVSINKCEEMQRHFSCPRCSDSFGFEQPAFVPFASASDQSLADICLISSDSGQSSCSASHAETTRLCPCIPKSDR